MRDLKWNRLLLLQPATYNAFILHPAFFFIIIIFKSHHEWERHCQKAPLSRLQWRDHTLAFLDISYFRTRIEVRWLTLATLKDSLPLELSLRWQNPSDTYRNQLLKGTALAHRSEQLSSMLNSLLLAGSKELLREGEALPPLFCKGNSHAVQLC